MVQHTSSFFFYILCWFFFTHFLAFITLHALAGHLSSALVLKVVVVFQFRCGVLFRPLLPSHLLSRITPCLHTLSSPSSVMRTCHLPRPS